MTSRFYVRLRL